MEQILKDNPKDVRFVYRYFPLISIHDKAALAVQAAQSAGAQGKFWEMHDLLFQKQSEWASLSVADFQTWLLDHAEGLSLDKVKFTTELTSQANITLAKKAWDENSAIGLPGTPFLVINGNIWPSNVPLNYDNIVAVIKLTTLAKREFSTCPPMTIDSTKSYAAILHTSKGDITMALYADKAPIAVNSFIFLAHNGWFDNVMFHRVIPGSVAQAGDPSGTGFGTPGYAFDNEISTDLKFDGPGVVGMANAGPGSNGSQFFITYTALPSLDGNYTIFGKVIAGLDVAEKLTPRDPSQGSNLPAGDLILSVTIEEK